jgi:2-oxoglutarate/2-oxoacid ferredoxin oxidoreductase subunit beta
MQLTRKDFDAGVDVRWCPGCGDYSILANMQRFLPTLGIEREKFVFISGIGCSSRFPYYMNTYGFHTIHGRAPAFATGLKMTRPDLHVWVVTGDGDALSIGGNHLIHAMRRNVDFKVLLFNNRIYGLTKGQYSPTSEVGKITKSTPLGSVDEPFKPLSVAIGAEATFVARCFDTDAKLMQKVFQAAHEHKGTALIEIYQNCNVFNDGAFEDLKTQRANSVLELEHDKPMIFGATKNQGMVWRHGALQVATIGQGCALEDVVVHNTKRQDPALAFMLARLEIPRAMGVLRQVERPTYDAAARLQVAQATTRNLGDLQKLLTSNETWKVSEPRA